MGNKERILELLKKNKAGMTAKELDGELDIGDNIYAYLKRLIDNDLVENIIPKSRVGKVIGYRATSKAWEEERKAKALERLNFIEGLAKRGAIKVYKDKLTPDEKEILEAIK